MIRAALRDRELRAVRARQVLTQRALRWLVPFVMGAVVRCERMPHSMLKSGVGYVRRVELSNIVLAY